ncbi:MAG: hypothetical protein ACTIJ9_01420 [Aequorivita sp.]
MKKLILSAAVVLGGLTAVTAQTSKEAMALNTPQTVAETQVESQPNTVNENEDTPVQDYKEVKASEVPQPVLEALAQNYSGATISKAYINAQGEYKLELATVDNDSKTVYINGNGEEVNKDADTEEQLHDE